MSFWDHSGRWIYDFQKNVRKKNWQYKSDTCQHLAPWAKYMYLVYTYGTFDI